MEITESMIYWITRLDGINRVLTGIAIALGCIACICILAAVVIGTDACSSEDRKMVKQLIKGCSVSLILCLISTIGIVFTPTTKEMYAIKVIPVLANNDGVREIPGDIAELANEWIEELRPKKGN